MGRGMSRTRMGSHRMRSGFCGLRRRARGNAERCDHRCASRKPAQRLRMPLKENTALKSTTHQRGRHRFPHAIRAPISGNYGQIR